jgi:hypothetical protein
MKRFLAYIGCVILGGGLVAAAGFFYQRYTSPLPSVAADTCLLEECLNGNVSYPVAQLDEQERVTLIELGLEQLRLETVLSLIEERFGTTVQPFPAALRIEQRQTIQLKGLFDKYGVSEPKLPASGMGDSLATTKRAGCVQALDQVRHFQERLYNERNSFMARPDVRRFMQEASKMSENSLQPAFERCAKEE